MLLRRPLQTAKEEKKADEDNPFFSRFWGGANLDDYEQFFVDVQKGFLITSTSSNAVKTIKEQTQALLQELTRVQADKPEDVKLFTLRRYPRILARSQFIRRLAQAFAKTELASAMDEALLSTFTGDESILEEIVGEYVRRGNMVAARATIAKSKRSGDELRRARFKVGIVAGEKLPATIPAAVAQRQLLPLIMDGREKEAVDILHRIVLPPLSKDDLKTMPLLGQFAVYLNEPDSGLIFARRHIDALLKFADFWEIEQGIKSTFTLHWARFSKEHQRALIGHMADKVVSDFKKNSAGFKVLASLEEFKTGGILTKKQMDEAIKKVAKRNYQNILPLTLRRKGQERVELLKTIFAEVHRNRRANMIIDLIVALPEAPDDEMVTFIRSKIPVSVGSLQRPMSIFQFDRILSVAPDFSYPLLLEVFEALVKETPEHLPYLVLRAQVGHRAGSPNAKVLLDQAFQKIIANGKVDDWITSRCLGKLIENLPTEKGKELIATIVESRKKNEKPAAMSYAVQMAILREMRDLGGAIEVAQEANLKYPKVPFFRREVYRLLVSTGRVWESLDALAAEIKESSVSKWRRSQAYRAWMKQKNPLRAAEYAGENVRGVGGREAPGKLLPPEVALVRGELEKKNEGKAAREFRRVWRHFDNERSFYIWRPIQLEWEKSEREPAGGLESVLGDEDKKTSVSAYSAIADFSFGESELRRQLRSMEANNLTWASDIQKGLAKAIVKRLGVAGAIDSLRQEIHGGQADANTYAVLLNVLEENTDVQVDGANEMLRDFAKTLSPLDDGKTRNLARVLDAVKEVDASSRLYRWVALRIGTVTNLYFSETPDLDSLLDEVASRFDESVKKRLVSTVLAVEKGRALPYGRSVAANKVLGLWGKLGDPKDALASNRTLCEKLAGQFDEDVSSLSYLAAAKLWLGAEELEKALACLRNSLCRGVRVRLGLRRCLDVFPVPSAKESFDSQWLMAASKGIQAWRDNGKMPIREANRILTILAERMARVGYHHEATQILRDVEPRLRVFSDDLLLVADVARVNGDKAFALKIESELLKDRRLDLSRVHRALVFMHESEGAKAAWDLGQTIVRYTLDPSVLRELLLCSQELGLEAEAQALRSKAKRAWPEEQF